MSGDRRQPADTGSFGDQGGGTGIHQWAAYITKAWMGCLGTSGVLDYLELFPDDAVLATCIERFADWLLATGWERDGFYGWSYQQDFNGGPRHWDQVHGKWTELPSRGHWHHDQVARIMTYMTMRTGRVEYFDAWAHSLEIVEHCGGGHSMAATAVFLPWVEARLWSVCTDGDGWRMRPLHAGPRTPTVGRIHTPGGPATVVWESGGVMVSDSPVAIAQAARSPDEPTCSDVS